MTEYIAFLRGINVSGKNKIVMSELKAEFEKLKFSNVSTYLNSGNISFESETTSETEIRSTIERMILNAFNLEIPVYITTKDALKDALDNAPPWWGTNEKEKYDNMIFILTDENTEKICGLVGEPSANLEMIYTYKNVIFWTFDRKSYQKCNWWKKTASVGIADKLTIRTANTVRKLIKHTS